MSVHAFWGEGLFFFLFFDFLSFFFSSAEQEAKGRRWRADKDTFSASHRTKLMCFFGGDVVSELELLRVKEKEKNSHHEQPRWLIFWMAELPSLYRRLALAVTAANAWNKFNLACERMSSN